jgi:hypothetical protein
VGVVARLVAGNLPCEAVYQAKMRAFLVGFVAASALLVVPSASAKDFGPGDLRVCNATRCVAIVNRAVLPALGSFYYSGAPLAHVRRPALGTPYFELRFRNDYVTGIVATQHLDRFLSYGVHLERFARGTWYAVPRRLSAELRRLTIGLRPLGVTRAALAKSR